MIKPFLIVIKNNIVNDFVLSTALFQISVDDTENFKTDPFIKRKNRIFIRETLILRIEIGMDEKVWSKINFHEKNHTRLEDFRIVTSEVSISLLLDCKVLPKHK